MLIVLMVRKIIRTDGPHESPPHWESQLSYYPQPHLASGGAQCPNLSLTTHNSSLPICQLRPGWDQMPALAQVRGLDSLSPPLYNVVSRTEGPFRSAAGVTICKAHRQTYPPLPFTVVHHTEVDGWKEGRGSWRLGVGVNWESLE